MKIFSSDQIKQIDNCTIRMEPVNSIDLMERASIKLLEWLISRFERASHFVIFTGPGNNGGDGLALARLLSECRYGVEIHHVNLTEKVSEDWNTNFRRIENNKEISFKRINGAEDFPAICSNDIIIDAIFGSGLSRPAVGLAGEIISKINQTGNIVVSVDIPSGLFDGDNILNKEGNMIKADYTLSFQFPKLSFLFPENIDYTGEWQVLPIGLYHDCVIKTNTKFYYIDKEEIAPLIRKRNKFDHKGIYGHGFLIAGSKGKFGAAILSSKAALRTGIGLITCHLPADGQTPLHSSIPEVMISGENNKDIIASLPDMEPYDAIGIGPGIGTDERTVRVLHDLLLKSGKKLVLDADAINILGMNKEWLYLLPENTVLTPHPKEFERLAGTSSDSYERLMKQISLSEKYKCIIVLKGAHTSVSLPDGRVYFNSTGNPGMATAGSGDVLTGMILSLLAQGYSPENASITGVYLHGLAGDLAAAKLGYESLIASDIIDNIGGAFGLTGE